MAALLGNQCDALIGYHFSASCDSDHNGERWLVDTVGPDVATFIDVGANVGDWTMMVLRTNPEARGVAIEPGLAALQRLRERLPSTVEIVAAAAGKGESGPVLFYEEAGAGVRSSAVRGWADTADERHVPVVTVDNLLDGMGWQSVDFLKIDTEGFDANVVMGSQQSLRDQRIGIVQFEYNRPWREAGGTLGAVIELFNSVNYDVYALRPTSLDRFDYRAFGEFFNYANFVAVSGDSPFRRQLHLPHAL
ncbi:MAG: FkbM family methyltransferase [Actinomycetota bacterium]|nr:FkbM family methyltransferase [Actinomycetota bacterium]